MPTYRIDELLADLERRLLVELVGEKTRAGRPGKIGSGAVTELGFAADPVGGTGGERAGAGGEWGSTGSMALFGREDVRPKLSGRDLTARGALDRERHHSARSPSVAAIASPAGGDLPEILR